MSVLYNMQSCRSRLCISNFLTDMRFFEAWLIAISHASKKFQRNFISIRYEKVHFNEDKLEMSFELIVLNVKCEMLSVKR